MSVEEYEQKHLGLCREKALDTYRGQMIGWLRTYPTLTAAQVCDWLKEHYHEQLAERTVSRYMKALREEYQLNFNGETAFEKVDVRPMSICIIATV